MNINSTGKSRFKVSKQNLSAFEKLCAQFVAKIQSEPKCLFYGFRFCGDLVYCREGHSDADGLLAHQQNVAAPLEETSKISTTARPEVHWPEEESAKLRGSLAKLNPQFFTLPCGFRRRRWRKVLCAHSFPKN